MNVSKTANGLLCSGLLKKFEIPIEGDFEFMAHDRYVYVGKKLPDNRTQLQAYDTKERILKDERKYDYFFGGFYMEDNLVKLKLYDYTSASWCSAYLTGTAGLCGFRKL
jgi:hypothetical protein